MTKTQVEVITSVQRRRRWTAAEKERLVAASLEPGASVSVLAREAGVHPSQLYGWRRQLCARISRAIGDLKSEMLAAAAALEVVIAEVGSDHDCGTAFETFVQRRVGALVVAPVVRSLGLTYRHASMFRMPPSNLICRPLGIL
jgi:transposase